MKTLEFVEDGREEIAGTTSATNLSSIFLLLELPEKNMLRVGTAKQTLPSCCLVNPSGWVNEMCQANKT